MLDGQELPSCRQPTAICQPLFWVGFSGSFYEDDLSKAYNKYFKSDNISYLKCKSPMFDPAF
jgi:hypothetical protein